MAYNEALANRVRRALGVRRGLNERKMFGGLAFMHGGRMCCGVLKDDVVIRIDPARYKKALREPHVRPMDFTGRPLRGFLYVGPGKRLTDRTLAHWLRRAVTYARSLPSK